MENQDSKITDTLPVQKVQETKPQNMQDVIEDYWAEDDYYL